jgi:hypothetical protein
MKMLIYATKMEFRTQIMKSTLRLEYGGYGYTKASVDGVKPLTFNGFMSWAMFHSQFDAVVEEN